MKLKSLFILLLCFYSSQSEAQKTLFIDKQEYSCAASFNVAVRTKNMSNVVALQGSVVWDASVVKYNGISYGSSAIAFNSSNVFTSASANGYLTYLWFDDNLQGRAVADSTPLFTINFIANSTGRGKANIDFSNTPASLEIDTLDGGGFPVNDLSAVFANGYIVRPSTYNFIGSGNWTTAANWSNNFVPPATLPSCSEIIVNPAGSSSCLLDVPQTVAPGAKLTVAASKRLIVAGNLTVQ